MIEQLNFETYTFSVFQKSKNDSHACGDSYWLKETEDEMIGVIADGLGSGDEAHLASEKAIQTVKEYQALPIEEIVHQVNRTQSHYRGVVLAIIKYNKHTHKLNFCGIGNICLKIVMSVSKVIQPRSKKGFLSGRPVQVEVQEFNIEPNAWLIMYSDGIEFRATELSNLYGALVNESMDAINHYFKTSATRLHDDDVTLLIGKPQ